MATRRLPAGAAITRDAGQSGRSAAWITLTVLLAVAGTAIAAYLPPALVLPAMSILMVIVGFAIAVGCYVAGFRPGHGPLLAWDIAGALVFLGFAASMLTDERDALSLLAQIETQGLAALSR